MQEFLYIAQSSLEKSKCKVGITNDLERRLKEYNATTGNSKENEFYYLFAASVANSKELEKDFSFNFSQLREFGKREIYFCNPQLLGDYISYIKAHKNFIQEIKLKENKNIVIIKPMIIPSMKERGINRKMLLHKAKRLKNDEFYTRYEDVEREMANYPLKIWKDKCVYCNCDDAVGDNRDNNDSSAFSLYFIRHFRRLKLKKLICTHYGSGADLFNSGTQGYIFTKEGASEIKNGYKNYNGGFEEQESLRILREEADIVCTNPPFSKAIEYWKILIASKKKFIIISNITNCINTGFIHYFKDKKAWAGYTSVDWYLDPKQRLVRAAGHFFTNIPIKDREKIKRLKILPFSEIPDVFKKYDDNGCLLMYKSYIPSDYAEPFAVSARQILNGILECGYEIVRDKRYTPYLNGKEQFARVLVQKVESITESG
ncbi:MAG: adenine-specific methyltransferase EcoRI family protein [Helicobacter sp.]|nr:adenine-specific methyltransferase EcoRI family protein [Helicobacter sp.]